MDDMTGRHLMKLHAELDDKRRFLLMDGIQSLLIPVIEDHKHEDEWREIKRSAIDALIGRDAPDFLKSIEKLYNDYEIFAQHLIEFYKYFERLVNEKIPKSTLNRVIGVIFKNCFLEIDHAYEIIEKSFQEAGETISNEKSRELSQLINSIARNHFDSSGNLSPRGTIISLRENMKELIRQIEIINSHIKKIIRIGEIFDYEEFTL